MEAERDVQKDRGSKSEHMRHGNERRFWRDSRSVQDGKGRMEEMT